MTQPSNSSLAWKLVSTVCKDLSIELNDLLAEFERFAEKMLLFHRGTFRLNITFFTLLFHTFGYLFFIHQDIFVKKTNLLH